MIDVPPPPAQLCVSIAAPEIRDARILVVVSGEPAQVEAVRVEALRQPAWRVEADASSNGVRFLRLAAPINIPYREVGGLVFEAQRRQLVVTFQAVPPVCELESR